MANISTYIRQIESASRGEEVRDSIIKALNALNNAIGTGGSGGGDFDAEALREIFDTGTIGSYDVFDSVPVQNSKRAVESGGLWIILGNIQELLDHINGEVIA